MKEVLLENWSVVNAEWRGLRREPHPHEFARLEVGNCLCGRSYGHSQIEDGHRICSSRIRTINGDIVTTMSETIYRLGERQENFVEPFSDDIFFTPEE